MTATFANRHFYALDAIRGVAAILVVCLHEYEAFSGLPRPFSGYLAVDLFFLLSGYVIASAYDRRLADGMSFSEFLKLRIIRLYPLYLIGFLIGLSRTLVQFQIGLRPPPTDGFAIGSMMELIMLPTPMTMDWQYDTLFFLNPPAWSLFFELLVNIFYALIYKHLSNKNLFILLIISGAALIFCVSQNKSLEIGNYWHTILWSAPRVIFPFFFGVWLHRQGPELPKLASVWAWPATLLIIPLMMWHPSGYQQSYDLIMVMCVFPAIVTFAAAIQTQGITTTACKTAGDISYAIYIVHMPLFGLLLAITRRLAPDWPKESYAGPLCIAAVALFCLALDRYYDKPVRKWLTSRLIRRGSSDQGPANMVR